MENKGDAKLKHIIPVTKPLRRIEDFLIKERNFLISKGCSADIYLLKYKSLQTKKVVKGYVLCRDAMDDDWFEDNDRVYGRKLTAKEFVGDYWDCHEVIRLVDENEYKQ